MTKEENKDTKLLPPFKVDTSEEILKELAAWIDTEFLAATLWNVAVECGIPLALAHLRVLWLRYQDMLEIDLTEIAETYVYEEKLVPTPDADSKEEKKEVSKAHVRDNVVQENQACDG